MPQPLYAKFCPVAMAADMLEPRWSMLVPCEIWSGSTRFNEIQRGVPGTSPSLLSKRLKDMVAKGLIQRGNTGAATQAEYHTTPLADELEPIVRMLGEWAHRNVESSVSLACLDARVLRWNIRRKINRTELPIHKCVIQFTLKNAPDAPVDYWLVIKPDVDTDLCYVKPGFNVDLFVICPLRALTSAWMGHTSFQHELAKGNIVLVGHAMMARTLMKWLITSSFARSAAMA